MEGNSKAKVVWDKDIQLEHEIDEATAPVWEEYTYGRISAPEALRRSNEIRERLLSKL